MRSPYYFQVNRFAGRPAVAEDQLAVAVGAEDVVGLGSDEAGVGASDVDGLTGAVLDPVGEAGGALVSGVIAGVVGSLDVGELGAVVGESEAEFEAESDGE